jgi:hypothetical protein
MLPLDVQGTVDMHLCSFAVLCSRSEELVPARMRMRICVHVYVITLHAYTDTRSLAPLFVMVCEFDT